MVKRKTVYFGVIFEINNCIDNFNKLFSISVEKACTKKNGSENKHSARTKTPSHSETPHIPLLFFSAVGRINWSHKSATSSRWNPAGAQIWAHGDKKKKRFLLIFFGESVCPNTICIADTSSSLTTINGNIFLPLLYSNLMLLWPQSKAATEESSYLRRSG